MKRTSIDGATISHPLSGAAPMRIERTEWTLEAERVVRALWGAQSAAVIGRQIGFSKNSVVSKANRLGLALQPSPIKRGGQAPRPVGYVLVHPDRLAAGLAPLPAFHPIAMERTA
jgi:GcrA cell cycle regulator